MSQSGGIGRRAGFKIPCPHGRVGSIPTSGTKLHISSKRGAFFMNPDLYFDSSRY